MKYILFTVLAFLAFQSNAEIIVGGKGSPASFPSGRLGVTDGTAAAAGQVGEILECTSTALCATSVQDRCSINLTPGSWLLSGYTFLDADTAVRRMEIQISDTSGGSGDTATGDLLNSEYSNIDGVGGSTQIGDILVNVDTNTLYYLGFRVTSIAGQTACHSVMRAYRLR